MDVTQVALNSSEASDAQMEHVTVLNQLQWLDLSHSSVSDAGLQYLAGLPRLRWLTLCDTKVSDAGLEHLKGLTQPPITSCSTTPRSPTRT